MKNRMSINLLPAAFAVAALVSTTLQAWAQTLPAAHNLTASSWTLTGWNSGVASGSYPSNGATGADATTGVVAGAATANMVFHWFATEQTSVPTADAGSNFACAYNLAARPRVNGLGANGIGIINTSSSQFDNCASGAATGKFTGAAVLGLNTNGRQSIVVSWTGRTVIVGDGNGTPSNPRVWKLRLQYRVGGSGAWTDVPGPVEYTSSTSVGSTAVGPTTLPSAVENQASTVYLRWAYFQSAAGNGGSRPQMGMDDITVSSSPLASNTITTGTVSGSPFCVTGAVGASVTVPFTAVGTYNSGNVYTAELSNAAGSFASPTSIGTLTSTALTGNVSATIPAGTASGSAYRIRVKSSNVATTGADNGTNLQVINGVDVVTALTAGAGNASATVTWVNPVGCFNDVLVVAHTAAIGGSPTGTSYTTSTVFGSGQAFAGGGTAIFQGSGTSTTITGLTNGTTYTIGVFARNGSNWGAGTFVTVTPQGPQFAFTQIGTTAPDMAEGITLKRFDLSALSFTDNGVCSNQLFRINEETAVTPFTGLNDVPAGTIVRFVDQAGTNDLDFSDGLVTKFNSGLTGISGSGDQVIAFTGTGNGALNCGGSGTNTYVAAINIGNSGFITSGTPTANSSYAPGTVADYHAGTQTDGRVTGTILGNASTILTAVKTPGNWTTASAAAAYNLKNILFNESNFSSGSLACSAVTNGSFNVDWSAVSFSGSDANTRFVVVVHTAAPTNPADRTTCFTPNANVASAPNVIASVTGQTATDLCGTPTTGNGKLVFMGYGTSVNVTGLTLGTNYQVRVYALNGNGFTANYSSSPASGNQTTTAVVTTEVSFITTTGSVNEANGSHQVQVAITNPSATVATTVQVALTVGTAADVNNYTTQTLTFPAGSSANQTLTIPITNDLIIEQNEVLTFSLQNPTGGLSAILGSNVNYDLTIVDNDFPTLVINEIMYNSLGNDEEWVELYNNGADPVVLSSTYTLENTAPTWSYAFPATTIAPGAYMTIQVGTAGSFPFTPTLIRGTSADQLNNATSTLSLKKGGASFDAVTYADVAPWPTSPDGTGPSLSLKHPEADNNNGAHWKSSCASGGTPITYNGVATLRSLASGNWPAGSCWQWKVEGTPNWTAAPSAGFVITCQTDVTIRQGHTITIPAGHIASADDVTISGILYADFISVLNVADKLNVTATGALNTPMAVAGTAVTINVAGDADNSGGTINLGNFNVLNLAGDYTTTYINTIMAANSVINLSDDWIFTSGADYQPVLTEGKVVLNGTSGIQEIGTTTFYNLVMQGTAPKQIAASAKVRVRKALELRAGTLTTTGGSLTLASDATGTAYLDNFSPTFTGTLVGPITMERLLSGGDNRYHFIGSAVAAPSIQTELSELALYGTDGAQLLPSVTCSSDSLFSGSPYGRLFEFRENATPGAYQPNCSTWGWHVRSTGTLQNGRGYASLLPYGYGGAVTLSVTGTPNNGNVVSSTLTTSGVNAWNGWHIVSNPYPSPWTWNPSAASAAGFDGQVQFYQATGPYTGQYVASVGPQVIASSQGFMIHRSSGSGAFTFTNAGRTTANSTFYSAIPWYSSQLELQVIGANGADQAQVYLSDEATQDRDLLWDADKLKGHSTLPSLFTMMKADALTVNAQDLLVEGEHRIIPLHFEPGTAGRFTIKAATLQGFSASTTIYLEDRITRTFIDLRTHNHVFEASLEQATDRFVIHFNPSFANATAIDSPATFSVFNANGVLSINNSGSSTVGNIELLSISGQRLAQFSGKSLSAGTTTLDAGQLPTGLYLVRIGTPTGSTSHKVLMD